MVKLLMRFCCIAFFKFHCIATWAHAYVTLGLWQRVPALAFLIALNIRKTSLRKYFRAVCRNTTRYKCSRTYLAASISKHKGSIRLMSENLRMLGVESSSYNYHFMMTIMCRLYSLTSLHEQTQLINAWLKGLSISHMTRGCRRWQLQGTTINHSVLISIRRVAVDSGSRWALGKNCAIINTMENKTSMNMIVARLYWSR